MNRDTYITRSGKSTKADRVFRAWTSGDLTVMLSVLQTPTNAIDRHFLLQTIVKLTYARRREAGLRQYCLDIAATHLKEMDVIIPALKGEFRTLPRISTFQYYAKVLEEDGEFDTAVAVCRQALALGLTDGTKGGFEGRIQRIHDTRRKRG